MHKKKFSICNKKLYSTIFFFNLGMFNVLAIINKIRGFMGYTYLSKYFNYFFSVFYDLLSQKLLASY